MTKHRILVIDATLIQRKALLQHLEMMDFTRIGEAASCEHAAHLLAEAYGNAESFDLILLDCHMPGGSGLRFLTDCRYDARFASVPIIMVTADPRNIPMFLKSGATSYIVKPVSSHHLKKKISQFLDRAKADADDFV
jgi:two-component system, chemotaxis family, chemotaxis protein CheY